MDARMRTTATVPAGLGPPGMLRLHPRHPFGPPDRRWRRAGALLDEGRRPGRLDDAYVRRSCRVRSALRRHGDAGHPRVVAADPPIVAALLILAAADPRRRLELEARLLAGQDDREIAGRLGLDPDAVAAYGAVFFDVRGALDQPDRIAAVALGARLHDGSGVGDPELAARLVGYLLGPLAVDAYFGHPVPDSDGLAAEIADYVALVATPVTEATAPRWLALAGMQAGLERRRREASAAPASGPIIVDAGVAEAAAGAAASALAEPVGEAAGPEAGIEVAVAAVPPLSA